MESGFRWDWIWQTDDLGWRKASEKKMGNGLDHAEFVDKEISKDNKLHKSFQKLAGKERKEGQLHGTEEGTPPCRSLQERGGSMADPIGRRLQ